MIPAADRLQPTRIPRLGNANDVELAARRIMEGLFHGRHRSRHTGSAIEFSDHRPYLAGDDLRAVDWKAYARSDRLVVRRFQVERDLPLVIVIDASASMDYGEPRKADWAALTTAVLSLLAIDQGDRVRVFNAGDTVQALVPHAGGPAQFMRICHAMAGLTWTSTGNFADHLRTIGRSCERRSLLVCLSDWLHDPVALQPALAELAGRGHEIAAVQILDASEVHLPAAWGRMLLRDPEGRVEPLACEATAAKAQYDDAIAAHIAAIRALLQASRGDHLLAQTDADPAEVLGTWLRRRKRVA